MKKLGIFLLIAVIIGSGYSLGVAALASYKFFKADQAGQNNRMTDMYQLQQQAISLNPHVASYHRRYALTNLALATALINKTDLTTADQTTLTKLIQQSIREAQIATQLQPTNASNWQILGQIYNNLIGTVTDADQWAISSYLHAIQLDPTNHKLKIALGSVFYSTDQFEPAVQLFTQAIELKPDDANAHYNLANTLVKQGKFMTAITAYEHVLELVEPGTADYQAAATELAATQTKLGQQ